MGQNSPQVRRRGSLAGAAVLALALTACSGPAPSGPPSGQTPASQPPSSSIAPVTPGTSAATAGATPDATAGATPDGGLGGFGTIAEACGAVSATVLSVLVLPMAAATGKDTADVEKAKEALARMQGQVPAELKDSFDKLKSIADDAGQDFSRFNTEEFDQAIAPIDAWLQAHC
jgi:hypothetical protein